MSEDFRERLMHFAKTAMARADRVTSEEAAKQYLVLPFFQLLGYDPLDPDEIIPEAHASFSDKFKNKVDYAICISGTPAVAVECKKTGALSEADKGELKGYFNAVASAKLGILTDGLKYDLYTDTGAENMMDDEPFVRIDLSKIAKENPSDQVLDALIKLQKGTFDPADVGPDAKRKLFTTRYVKTLEKLFANPTESFLRFMMDEAAVDGRRTNKMVEEHMPIIAEALQSYFDRKILERVGFASREDIVKVNPTAPVEAQTAPTPANDLERKQQLDTGIITTATELRVFDWVKTRLSFLISDEDMFRRLSDLLYSDYKTVFAVYYKQERKGKLFNFRELSDGTYRFDFMDGETPVVEFKDGDLTQIDKPLLETFAKRIAEFR